MKPMTMSEVKMKVSEFYNGYLDERKSLKLFEVEYGYIPEIIPEPVDEFYVGFNALNEEGLIPEGVTKVHLVWMKKLQESCRENMIVGPICRLLEQNFLIDRETATNVHKTYLKYYNHLYHPEDIL